MVVIVVVVVMVVLGFMYTKRLLSLQADMVPWYMVLPCVSLTSLILGLRLSLSPMVNYLAWCLVAVLGCFGDSWIENTQKQSNKKLSNNKRGGAQTHSSRVIAAQLAR
jgi:hypothetical protein